MGEHLVVFWGGSACDTRMPRTFYIPWSDYGEADDRWVYEEEDPLTWFHGVPKESADYQPLCMENKAEAELKQPAAVSPILLQGLGQSKKVVSVISYLCSNRKNLNIQIQVHKSKNFLATNNKHPTSIASSVSVDAQLHLSLNI